MSLWVLFSDLWSVFCILVIVYVFFTSNLWKYITTPKQKVWTPDFLFEGEELRVVRIPYSFPKNKLIVIDYGYGHNVITSNEDVIIYWKKSDYYEAKRLYEDQIMVES